jgi:hypothetical protein
MMEVCQSPCKGEGWRNSERGQGLVEESLPTVQKYPLFDEVGCGLRVGKGEGKIYGFFFERLSTLREFRL